MLIDKIKKNAHSHIENIALIDPNTNVKIYYRDLINIIKKSEKYFREESISVVISLGEPNIYDLIFLMGIGTVNGTWIPLPENYEISYFLNHFKNKTILVVTANKKKIFKTRESNSDPQDNLKDNIFLITCSSGTTGKAKGISISQSKKLLRIQQAIDLFSLKSQDIIVSNSPIFHSMGQKLFFSSLCVGATLIRNVPFSPKVWADICDEFSPTFGIPISTQINLLRKSQATYAETFKTFRAIVLSSATASPELKQYLLQQETDIWETFGCSETAFLSASKLIGQENDHVGGLIENVDLRISPTNSEILVKTPYLCDGYFENNVGWENAFTSDSFFKTGDVGEIKEGKLYFHGRLGLEFLVGPYRINPMELENSISKNILDDEVVVVPINNPVFGDTVGLYINTKHSEPDKTKIFKELKGSLPKYQVPTRIEIIKNWPLLPNGKLDRQKLIAAMNE